MGEIDRCFGLTRTVLPDGTLRVTNAPQHLPLRELIGRVLASRPRIDCFAEPVAAPGHAWSGTLSGRVIDGRRHPLPGIELEIRADQAGWTAGITTDADGRFLLTGLPAIAVDVRAAGVDLQLPPATSELEFVVPYPPR